MQRAQMQLLTSIFGGSSNGQPTSNILGSVSVSLAP